MDRSTAALFATALALLQPDEMKRAGQRSKLQQWQADDADRLKALLDEARRRKGWPGQDAFAERAIGRSGSFLTQLATGYRPLNVEHAAGLAAQLGVDVAQISPTLARKIAELGSPGDPAPAGDAPHISSRVADQRASYTLHGMQISPEEAQLGVEWGKLDEPARTAFRELLEVLVAEQIRAKRRRSKSKDDRPDIRD